MMPTPTKQHQPVSVTVGTLPPCATPKPLAQDGATLVPATESIYRVTQLESIPQVLPRTSTPTR